MDQKHLDTLQNIGFNVMVFDENTPTCEDTMTENTEANMLSKIGDAFEIAKNAVSDSFSLRDEINKLKADFAKVQSEFKSLQFTIQGYDERIKMSDTMLIEVRIQRNQAQDRVRELELENAKLKQDVATHQRESEAWRQSANYKETEVCNLKSQLSALEDDHIKLMEEHEKVKAKLEQIKSLFGSVNETVPEPVEVPQFLPAPSPQPEENNAPAASAVDPSAVPAQEPTSQEAGERWPSSDQPHDPTTGWFLPRSKNEEVH